jgi:hypothetical protein
MRFVRRIPGGGDLIQDVAVMAGDRLEQGDAIAKLVRGSGGHERLKRPETVPGVGGLGDAGQPGRQPRQLCLGLGHLGTGCRCGGLLHFEGVSRAYVEPLGEDIQLMASRGDEGSRLFGWGPDHRELPRPWGAKPSSATAVAATSRVRFRWLRVLAGVWVEGVRMRWAVATGGSPVFHWPLGTSHVRRVKARRSDVHDDTSVDDGGAGRIDDPDPVRMVTTVQAVAAVVAWQLSGHDAGQA